MTIDQDPLDGLASLAVTHHDVVIVGAGMAGLAAARRLREKGHEPLVVEAESRAGGRVHTDVVDGFRLDLGFQVLLTAYPEAQRVFDYERLDLRSFESGAVVRVGDRFHRVGDPFRSPGDLFSSLRAPVGTRSDKLRILRFRRQVMSGDVDDIFTRAEMPASRRLSEAGFSDQFIETFLRPLFASITHDPTLSFSSRHLEFIFRMFTTGEAAVPATGMKALTEQLLADLPDDAISYHQHVESVAADHVIVDGEKIRARAVVLATDQRDAAALSTEIDDRGSVGVVTFWMAAAEPPFRRPAVVLAGSPGPINNLAVMSQISDLYAPPDQALVAVSCPDPSVTEPAIRAQLTEWFGGGVEEWQTIRVDRIESAHPRQPVGLDPDQVVRLDSGLFVAGDHRQSPSIEGALVSGRRAGDAVAARLCRDC